MDVIFLLSLILAYHWCMNLSANIIRFWCDEIDTQIWTIICLILYKKGHESKLCQIFGQPQIVCNYEIRLSH